MEVQKFSQEKHTSIIVIDASGSRSGPTEADSTVKVNLDAKSSLDNVSTYKRFHIYHFRDNNPKAKVDITKKSKRTNFIHEEQSQLMLLNLHWKVRGR